ncbi:EF hand [Teladorsagia circumcincta]|uniref:EF hand n=1 Tax=Teladorsagia circumcincta TaxID=45464 RepID=A0A2G9UXI7_TELCI|nr:EF hand [Teladorsagia circumcincta]
MSELAHTSELALVTGSPEAGGKEGKGLILWILSRFPVAINQPRKDGRLSWLERRQTQDRSGAIALDELETAIRNLGLEQTRDELDKIIDEVDQRGNHQIDFDEFCVVMRRLYMKKRSWNEVVKECFSVFDRSESSVISKKDFQYILRELGDITDNQIIDEIFLEADVDGNGLIDYDEFSYMVKNYMTDDDIN